MSAKKDALNSMNEPVPLHLRNAPTKLMKDLDLVPSGWASNVDPKFKFGF